MARYILEDGEETTADDPRRLVWYSARCGFYTDDWEALSKAFEIPICPCCSSPGFMVGFERWEQSAVEYEKAEGHPGYPEFLKLNKAHCDGGKGMLERYRAWAQQRAEQN